jgi:hypothetical protein
LYNHLMEGFKMANENLKKFLDSAGVGYLWGKVTKKIADDVKVEADRAQAAEKALSDKLTGIDTTVVAYVDDKTKGIASEGVVNDLSDRVGTIEKDYAKTADVADTYETKANVQTITDNLNTVSGKVDTLIGDDANKSVRTIANEELAAQLVAEGAAESLDTLQEIAAWIQSHPDDAAAMNEAIAALQAKVTLGTDGEGNEYATVKAYVEAAIAALQIGDYAKAADLAELAGKVTTLEGKVDVDKVSTAITAAKTEANTYTDTELAKERTRIDALVAINHDAYKDADAALKTDLEGQIAAAKTNAVADAKTYTDGLNSAMNGRVEALEAIDHDHSNKDELDKIAAGDVAKWNAMEGNAKAYTDAAFANITALTTGEIDAAIGATNA